VPQVAVRLVLAALLLAAAGLKLADPRRARAALATFGIGSARSQRATHAAIVAAEIALAAGVAAGADLAAYLAAGLMLAFALALTRVLGAGRAGAPCGCFGARSRVSRAALARALGLAAAFAVVPALPEGDMSTDAWLATGLAAALLAVAGLGVAVLALAREVGMLRLALGPQTALELAEEGPELGGRTRLAERMDISAPAQLGLAVFTSDGCSLCERMRPAVELLRSDAYVAVATFDEVADAEVWRALDVPGSPFAVAVDREGVALAKGTFNSLAQLEGLLAVAERRAAAHA
jgi:methylamine utilization protein MauE